MVFLTYAGHFSLEIISLTQCAYLTKNVTIKNWIIEVMQFIENEFSFLLILVILEYLLLLAQ